MDLPFSRYRQAAEIFVQFLIAYSIVTMCLETMPELAAYESWFFTSERIVVTLFVIEYLIRWAYAKRPLHHPFTFYAVVDLLAILPSLVSLGLDWRGLRAIRFLRIFRILKLARYSRALQTLGEAFRRTSAELTAFAFIAGIVILISAMALYYTERESQPHVYSSIPASLWWAIVTLTTVGYGDVYPQTWGGKMVASIIMITGIGFVALPTGLLSTAR